MEDLFREQHVRRLSLVLQRHGLDLLMGPGLWPCPTTGGINEMDFALRREVHAVDGLDIAALAAVGFQTLGTEIELGLTEACIAPPIELPAHHTMKQPPEVLDGPPRLGPQAGTSGSHRSVVGAAGLSQAVCNVARGPLRTEPRRSGRSHQCVGSPHTAGPDVAAGDGVRPDQWALRPPGGSLTNTACRTKAHGRFGPR